MTKNLDSVRRSLFDEFNEDNPSDAKKTIRTSIKFSNAFIAAAVIITAAIAVFSNKLLQTLLTDMSADLSSKLIAGVEWTKNNSDGIIEPIIYSLAITIFTAMILYLDSDIPGVNPPTPFSPRKALQYSKHIRVTNHLNYLVIYGSGFITFCTLYFK